MDDEKVKLYNFIVQHYSLNELRDLCFHLGVDSDDLDGNTRKDKTRELVEYLSRRRRLADLHLLLRQQRTEPYLVSFPSTETAEIAVSSNTELERNPRQVFISHAMVDAAIAHQLADDLQNAGYTIWIAPESIPPGQWVRAINHALEQSGVMLLVLSPAAVESPWVEMETNVAIEQERSGEMRFIPLLWQSGRFPALWRAYQYVPFNSGYEAGLAALLTRLDGRTIPFPILVEGEKATAPALPDRRTHEKTGIELIRIPAGLFIYGEGDKQRTIDLSEYWIGRSPVTNAQFARFVQTTGYRTTAEEKSNGYVSIGSKRESTEGADWQHPGGPKSSVHGKDKHPVVQVSWDDAEAFCEWAGLILPSEEQWEKAARGTDGRIWPWDNKKPPTDKHCNFNRDVNSTTPVGNYSPLGDSPYGCLDMAGNVWEWTGSWYEEGSTRALRGGSWRNDMQGIRAAYRSNGNPVTRSDYVGFRVAKLLSDPD